MRGDLRSLLWRQALFTLVMVGLSGLAAAVAFQWVGPKGVEGVVISGLLCLIPGWLTILIGGLVKQGSLAVYLVLVAMMNRMIFVLVGVLAVKNLRPDLGFYEFTIWLLTAYMVALALETWLVLSPSSSG
ncbi:MULTISPECIES: hypothetical protein [unclassified Schlesneria]|uniref:hypothetical protein n=1 Tax=Schlesneria TaxID=656899 RepID=UPI002F1CAF0F